MQADFENFRRRTNIEKEQLSTFVTANVVGKFLKVLDNFERAEASVEKGDNVDAVHEAVMRGHNPELDDEIVDMVFEKGYKLGDKVIRHSKVRVNTNE